MSSIELCLKNLAHPNTQSKYLPTPPQSKQHGMETFLDEYSSSFQWTLFVEGTFDFTFSSLLLKSEFEEKIFIIATHY